MCNTQSCNQERFLKRFPGQKKHDNKALNRSRERCVFSIQRQPLAVRLTLSFYGLFNLARTHSLNSFDALNFASSTGNPSVCCLQNSATSGVNLTVQVSLRPSGAGLPAPSRLPPTFAISSPSTPVCLLNTDTSLLFSRHERLRSVLIRKSASSQHTVDWF